VNWTISAIASCARRAGRYGIPSRRRPSRFRYQPLPDRQRPELARLELAAQLPQEPLLEPIFETGFYPSSYAYPTLSDRVVQMALKLVL
jgi:hypothetical protein